MFTSLTVFHICDNSAYLHSFIKEIKKKCAFLDLSDELKNELYNSFIWCGTNQTQPFFDHQLWCPLFTQFIYSFKLYWVQYNNIRHTCNTLTWDKIWSRFKLCCFSCFTIVVVIWYQYHVYSSFNHFCIVWLQYYAVKKSVQYKCICTLYIL